MSFDAIYRRLMDSNDGDYIFSFAYDRVMSAQFLAGCRREFHRKQRDGSIMVTELVFTDEYSGLRVTCQTTEYKDFSAVEWVLYFENACSKDTGIIENVLPLDIKLNYHDRRQMVLHRTGGSNWLPDDFKPEEIFIEPGSIFSYGGLSGSSSKKDLPFFKIDSIEAAIIMAIGWSGQWEAGFAGVEDGVRITAGMSNTGFVLHPGEKVRTPGILIMYDDTDRDEINNRFRHFIFRHKVPAMPGKLPQPWLMCSSYFMEGLNKTGSNGSNQLLWIEACGRLGVEAYFTDLRWIGGEWPKFIGDWTPDPERYPEGLNAVSRAAHENNLYYGAWFALENATEFSAVAKEHPGWLLSKKSESNYNGWMKADVYVLNFGLEEVREYALELVGKYMKMPGFTCFRQEIDLNGTDLSKFWQDNDGQNRRGITEMKYIEGLYSFLDSLREAFPGAFLNGCFCGGRRMDIEMVKRFHTLQYSEKYFDPEYDQSAIFSLSRYLPNVCFSAGLNRLDDYNFCSSALSSMALGFKYDEPEADMERVKQLADRFKLIRLMFNGSWYPLTEYTNNAEQWLCSQYYLPESKESLVIAFRRSACKTGSLTVYLKKMDIEANYLVSSIITGDEKHLRGEGLCKGFDIEINECSGVEMLIIKKL